MKNLTLKAIKYMASLSEETHCYTADLYLDGVRIAQVGNHGHGGCDFQHAVGGFDLAALDREIKETYPSQPNTFDALLIMHQDIESICNELVSDFLIVRDIKRSFKKKVVLVRAEGGIIDVGYKVAMTAEMERKVREHVAEKYPNAIILNGLTDEEIITHVRKDEARQNQKEAA